MEGLDEVIKLIEEKIDSVDKTIHFTNLTKNLFDQFNHEINGMKSVLALLKKVKANEDQKAN